MITKTFNMNIYGQTNSETVEVEDEITEEELRNEFIDWVMNNIDSWIE